MTDLMEVRKKADSFVNRIFMTVGGLKVALRGAFNVDGKVELIKNMHGIDDEIGFFDKDGFCYSFYIMRGNSGRVIVVETGVFEG